MPPRRRPRPPAPHPHALPQPPAELTRGRNAFELLRVWSIDGDLITCSASVDDESGPEAWGHLFFRVAMHLGHRVASDNEGADAEQVVYRILRALQEQCEEGFQWDRMRELPT